MSDHPDPVPAGAQGSEPVIWATVWDKDEEMWSVCAFEGDPRDGIMVDVIAEVTAIEDDKAAPLIAAAPALAEAGRLLDLAFSDGEDAPVPDEIIAGAFGDDMLEALQKMRAALRLARGES